MILYHLVHSNLLVPNRSLLSGNRIRLGIPVVNMIDLIDDLAVILLILSTLPVQCLLQITDNLLLLLERANDALYLVGNQEDLILNDIGGEVRRAVQLCLGAPERAVLLFEVVHRLVQLLSDLSHMGSGLVHIGIGWLGSFQERHVESGIVKS